MIPASNDQASTARRPLHAPLTMHNITPADAAKNRMKNPTSRMLKEAICGASSGENPARTRYLVRSSLEEVSSSRETKASPTTTSVPTTHLRSNTAALAHHCLIWPVNDRFRFAGLLRYERQSDSNP